MLKRLKTLVSNWLGVTELEQKVIVLIDGYDTLVGEVNDIASTINAESSKAYTGGSVQAKGRVDYAPAQTGNVVVAEPKILSVERGKR
jgi:hypothetical protein